MLNHCLPDKVSGLKVTTGHKTGQLLLPGRSFWSPKLDFYMESGPPGGSPLLPEVLSDLDPLPGSEQEVWKDREIQTKYDSDSTRSRSLKLSFSFLACETELDFGHTSASPPMTPQGPCSSLCTETLPAQDPVVWKDAVALPRICAGLASLRKKLYLWPVGETALKEVRSCWFPQSEMGRVQPHVKPGGENTALPAPLDLGN
ncbi:uncharacterized protein [Pseudorca crassidens]|uniref:uncharacterized protein n=1 Tax=Pseudorca crassidens TaxID=82174 RepID=UPI00352E6696